MLDHFYPDLHMAREYDEYLEYLQHGIREEGDSEEDQDSGEEKIVTMTGELDVEPPVFDYTTFEPHFAQAHSAEPVIFEPEFD
jgi:hypothetical protein